MTRLSLPWTTLTIAEADRIVDYVRAHGEDEMVNRLHGRGKLKMSALELRAFCVRNRFMWREIDNPPPLSAK